MKYFPLLYRLRTEKRYLIWITNEQDSVVVDAAGFVPSFRDLISLRQYADLNHYPLEGDQEKAVLHNLDWVARWSRAHVARVDCAKVLEAWNIFADIAVSVGSRGTSFRNIDSRVLWPIYDKLFWGNNLPAVTPKGKRYVPEWSPDELGSLAEVLAAGLDMFASCVRSWPQKA